MFEKALELALKYHKGQKKMKTGEPYIVHILRVTMRMKTEDEMIVALLHDILEKSVLTLNDLKKLGFSKNVLSAVDCLTRRKSESYDKTIDRIIKNKLAVRVKIADLEDNMNISNWNNVTDTVKLNRHKKYWQQLVKL